MNTENKDLDVIQHLNSLESFQAKIEKGISLVFITAVWNRTGIKVESEIEKVATKYNDKINVYKVDLDEAMEIPINLEITSFPAILIYKDNVLIEMYQGFVTENILSNKLDSILS